MRSNIALPPAGCILHVPPSYFPSLLCFAQFSKRNHACVLPPKNSCFNSFFSVNVTDCLSPTQTKKREQDSEKHAHQHHLHVTSLFSCCSLIPSPLVAFLPFDSTVVLSTTLLQYSSRMGETRRFMNMMRSHRRSPFTFSYILLPLCLCLLSVFSTQCLVLSQLQTEEYIPILVANPVVARAVNKLYILSGDANSAGVYTRIGQFMSLDLAIPWASTAPAWKRLADGPSNVNFPAAFSSNEQTLFVFQAQGANSPWSYKVQNGSWQKWDEIRHAGIEGVGAVMDPQTGAIYLAGGYNDTSIEMSSITYLDIFDPITQATQTLHLPDPNDVFFIRRNYGNVWSNYLRSILYWGGTNAVVNLHTPVSLTNQVTRLQTDIMDWSTMVGIILSFRSSFPLPFSLHLL